MDFIKWGQKQVRQFALNLTETELRTEEATNNDPWGPHGSEMAKLAEEALDHEKYREIMGVIARRLNDTGENWRHVYKALLLLEHLIKHGPIRVARDTQANGDLLRSLQSFEYKDKTGRDQGLNVRNRAKELVALVSDGEKLEEARENARINRDKYKGASKTEMKFMDSDAKSIPSYNQATPKRVIYEAKEEAEVDPFEATRKRIEKLKATEKEETPTMKVTVPQKKEPKKLSQVKVNPEIAATFVKYSNTVATTSTTTAPSAQNTVDLLGELEQDFSSFEQPTQSPSFFTSAESQNDEWADFTANQASVPQGKPNEDPFGDILTKFESTPLPPQKEAVKSPPPSIPKNEFTLDATPWPSPTTNNIKPEFQLTGLLPTSAGAKSRDPGAPMNPNVVRQRPVQKEDPFAGLGFI